MKHDKVTIHLNEIGMWEWHCECEDFGVNEFYSVAANRFFQHREGQISGLGRFM